MLVSAGFNATSVLASSYEDSKSESLLNTHYFGRLEIALPCGSEISADYKNFDEKIEWVSNEGDSRINQAVDQKVEDLKKGIAVGTFSVYEKTVPLDNGSVLLVSRLNKFYTFNVYLLTAKNTLYHMMAANISEQGLEGGIEKMRLLSNSIYSRPPHRLLRRVVLQ